MSRAPLSAFSATLAPEVLETCRIAATPEQVSRHHHIRREVFVTEQCLFAGTDTDGHDCSVEVIKVLGYHAGQAGGAVRLYPLDRSARQWQGDRLAVLPSFRTHGLAKPLVRFAVGWAAALGGETMVAHIQIGNVAFFERLGWTRQGDQELYVGVPHQQMAIDLRV
jgi:putative N-acetyltransferase (TIGR04045 family)